MHILRYDLVTDGESVVSVAAMFRELADNPSTRVEDPEVASINLDVMLFAFHTDGSDDTQPDVCLTTKAAMFTLRDGEPHQPIRD